MLNKLKIPNKQNELLDVWIEGKEDPKTTIIFVHGFGVDKHETAGYFDDLTKAMNDVYMTVRFDFSGCGESDGKLEEKDYRKWSEDLSVVIDYVKNSFQGDIYILAQSMGCFVTALLNPIGIKKTVFTGLPNSNTQHIIDRLFKRFAQRPGGKLDLEGISIFPRSSGAVQKIGPRFFKILKSFNPLKSVSDFSKKTDLLIVHPKQDEVVGSEFLKEYSTISNVKIEWFDGDHSFTKKENRENLIKEIEIFFEEGHSF